MPRITRSRVSLTDSSMIRFTGITIGIAGLVSLGALFLGFSDKGAIDVNTKIASTDQSTFETKVNAARPIDLPNGGLVPSETQIPPPPPEPAPEVSGASTTEATITEETGDARVETEAETPPTSAPEQTE